MRRLALAIGLVVALAVVVATAALGYGPGRYGMEHCEDSPNGTSCQRLDRWTGRVDLVGFRVEKQKIGDAPNGFSRTKTILVPFVRHGAR